MHEKSPGCCEYLTWDSGFFGRRIGRVLPARLTPELVAEVEAWRQANRIDCLYALVDSDDRQTIHLAEKHGFTFVDVRLTLSCALPREIAERPLRVSGLIRPARGEDLPAIRTIARESHQDSRFYFDPHFERQRCDALYETWIEKSCHGYADAVLVAEKDNGAIGYITCQSLDASTGQIGLLAVSAGAARQGFGSALIASALGWFRDRGHEQVRVVTQGRNIRAQRSYQRAGFVVDALQLWYHRWWLDPRA